MQNQMQNYVRKTTHLAFKVNFTIAISVKYVNNTLYKWVLMQLWQRHEFIDTQRARLIKI